MLSMEETHKIHFLFTEFSITQIFIKFTLVLFCFYTLIFISEYCLNNCSLVKDMKTVNMLPKSYSITQNYLCCACIFIMAIFV